MFCVVWNSSFMNRYQCFKPCAISTVRTAILKWRQKVTLKRWCIWTIPYRQGAQCILGCKWGEINTWIKQNIFVLSYVCLFLFILTTTGYFQLVTRLFHLENLLKHWWRSISCACKLPAYYILQTTYVSPNTDMPAMLQLPLPCSFTFQKQVLSVVTTVRPQISEWIVSPK
jgi:hypothetical protein